MSLVPDIFEYEGPLDLTDYYVRKTELRAETGDLIRVKVSTRYNGWTSGQHGQLVLLNIDQARFV